METLYQVLGLIAAIFIVWFLYRTVKGQPEQFSKNNLNKSFRSMGILAVILIIFVGFLVMLLRNT
ncbi:Uncharacterised protein (plasmid) [Legionella adelaidensis]|uniref:Transmembrane protein n=1 Tax=Legionella adelaidensis TaxID=45056 RepID=A0A0W0R2K2_9GAMM|nr:hypothetical protein [Legionella adelaidensis]KTC65318.1 hypothetical protein Lade_1340 [Legionella adelaidensis]VEH86031.1 Uncharacterised protein [Legionella adelaidensis]